MKTENRQRAPNTNTETRIKAAARLSRDTPPEEICEVLGIQKRTLQRYAKTPLWQKNGGVELPSRLHFKKVGRPTTDPAEERRKLTEASKLYNQGMTWKAVAAELGMTIRQLEHLRTKYPAEG